ncbi:MAG: DUF4465 domain-containing protein [Thermogutta sp.]
MSLLPYVLRSKPMIWPCLLMVFHLCCPSNLANAGVVDFEDVGASLPAESYWNGAPNSGNNTFISGGFVFHNNYNATWDVWDGFAYSNKTDTTTPGYLNQYSAITGSGAGGSRTYGVSFVNLWGSLPMIEVPGDVSLVSLQVTNTTYAYYSMLNGDQFAKKFGGGSGNDPDWFKLIIFGKDLANQLLGQIEFYLADFRFDDNSQDYILNTWQTVDLTPISNARILEFSLDSSDVGPWGMNTPAYFALDDIVFTTTGNGAEVIPEPASMTIFGVALAAGAGISLFRRRKSTAERA